MTDKTSYLDDELAALRRQGLYNTIRTLDGPQGAWLSVDGRDVLNFCSNNYLGLANDPTLVEAAKAALDRYGIGPGAVRTIAGTMTIHQELEAALARFKGVEAAISFQSGFVANLAVIPALVGDGDVIVSDELNHASIVDGVRLARAGRKIYPHGDVDALADRLAEARTEDANRILVITDGVFSMDGDVAPLPELVELARRHGCRLLVDEAHGTGAIGPGGRGAVAEAGLQGEVDVIVGTLGKALGSYGAYASGSAELVELLVNSARPFIFSTALPPPSVGAATAALEVVQAEPQRVERLQANAELVRSELQEAGFETGESRTQILPLQVGEADAAMALCERALERGAFAQAIRPPTVPEGTSRLRLTVMATHRPDELRRAAAVIASSARELGLVGEPRPTLEHAA